MWKQMLTSFFIISCCCFQANQGARSRLALEVSNVFCSFNRPIIQLECSFLKVKSSSYTFDSVILFERNISREFDVQLTVRVLPSRGKTVIKFIDLKINLCDGLQTSFINPLTKSLFAEMRKSSNIPYECPLVGNFTYTFKNFSLTEKNLPLYTPSVNYTFALLLWEKARMVANFTLLGSVQN